MTNNLQGKECKEQYGLLADALNALGAKFNFTWSADLEVSDAGWGLKPKNDGPYNASSEWEGVLGSVINNQVCSKSNLQKRSSTKEES